MNLTRATYHRAGTGLLLVFLALALPQASQAQTSVNRILAETNRLEKTLSSLKLSEDETKARAAAIASVRQILQSGQLYLGLYRLQPVWVEIMAQAYAASKAEIEQQGNDAFEKEWQRLGLELTEKEKRLAAASSGNSPAATDALVESALTQVRPYYQSGKLYGLNTTIRNGLFYMGLAPAHIDFAIFCRELRLQPQAKPLKFRSLNPELTKLEAEILESYRLMDSSDNQPQFIRLNSSLKMAMELDREGRFAGALLKYLETVLFLSLLKAPPPDAKDLPRLVEQSRVMEGRLKKSGIDHSIGLIFIESAQGSLEEAARGRPDLERLKRATVIIDRLLPRYFELVSGDK